MKIRAFWLVFEGDGAEVCSFRGFNGACASDVAVAIRTPRLPQSQPLLPATRNLRRSMDERRTEAGELPRGQSVTAPRFSGMRGVRCSCVISKFRLQWLARWPEKNFVHVHILR